MRPALILGNIPYFCECGAAPRKACAVVVRREQGHAVSIWSPDGMGPDVDAIDDFLDRELPADEEADEQFCFECDDDLGASGSFPRPR